jgi:hypothetical protein
MEVVFLLVLMRLSEVRLCRLSSYAEERDINCSGALNVTVINGLDKKGQTFWNTNCGEYGRGMSA